MQIYRLSKKKYSSELSGVGAALSNNRWNSKGTEMIYTAQSRALAMAEVLVHLDTYALDISYMMLSITLPDHIAIWTLDKAKKDWNLFPNLVNTQKIGDHFIHENKYAVARVPSAVVKGDYNYLINPHHSDFKYIILEKVTPFLFDNRLF